jgi:hypothetical protein
VRVAGPKRPPARQETHSSSITTAAAPLPGWVKNTFTVTGSALPIPLDLAGHIYGTGPRRTLAYFIVRQPPGG